METLSQAFRRRFSTQTVLTVVAGISLLLAMTMLGLSLVQAQNTRQLLEGVCFGVDGIDGSVGETGATGANGQAGVDGTGIPGPVGSQGSMGETGKEGATGSQGPAGNTGEQGAAGETGQTGDTGAQGQPGQQGQQGISGVDGTAGSDGVDGANGATGATGATGAIGADGAKGADGVCALIGDILPAADNIYSLGSSQFRWKSIQLGPGTIWIQDTSTLQQVGITVTDGTLLLDGAESIRIGNIQITSTGITDVSTDAELNFLTNGFMQPTTGIQFPDGTQQTTAPSNSGIPEGYQEYGMCVVSPQQYVLFGSCEENHIHGRNIVMLSGE